jgi:Trypsin
MNDISRSLVNALLDRLGSGSIVIAGGTPAAFNEYECCCPVVSAGSTSAYASGVLIANSLVLTAGHVARLRGFVLIPTKSVGAGTRIDVNTVELNSGSDLALLVLNGSTSARPAKLSDSASLAEAILKGVRLCGFGKSIDSFGHTTSGGKKIVSRVTAVTQPATLPDDSRYDPNKEFLVGGMTASGVLDAEKGDSGSPALLGDDPELTVVGIDSRNASGHRSVFTRVDKHLDWIRQVAQNYHIHLP